MTWLVPAACLMLVANVAGGIAAAWLYRRGARDTEARREQG